MTESPSKPARRKRPGPRKRRRKGTGGLVFRPDKGLWQFDVELPKGPDGKRRRRTLYGHTEVEVERKLADLKAKGGGTIRPVDPTTVSEYAAQWLVAVKGRVKAKTAESYEWAWGHAKDIIGGVRLDRFDREGALLLFSELERAGATANTVRHVARVMQTLIQDAIADGVYVGENPFKIVSRRKPKHKADPGRALSVAEAQRFIVAARKVPTEAAWILGLTAGLRIGEMFGLQWADVDFKKRAIFVQRQAIVVDGKLTIDTPKTEESVRLIPLGALAIDALQRRKKAASSESKSEWVFPSDRSDLPLSPNAARRRDFDAIKKAAKITGSFHPHDLRHTMNSIGDAVGIPEKVRSERMGHADSTITRTTYTHTIDGQARAAAAKIDAALTKPAR